MTASLQTKKGRPNYYIVLAYKDEKNGKNKTKWISTDIPTKGNNKRLTNEKLKEIMADYEGKLSQNVDLSNDILFTTYLKEWLENYKNSIAEVTHEGYRRIIYNQLIPFFEPKKLKVRDVTPMHIQQYITFKLKTVSPNTVRKHLWNISKCLDSAVRLNIIPDNPVKQIDMPKKVKYTGAQFYDEGQIAELLMAAKGDPLENIIIIALFYGLRRSEVMGLKWSAIDFNNNTISICHTNVQMASKMYRKDSTKNSSSYRTMPMPLFIKDILKSIRKMQAEYKLMQPNDYIDEGYVFTHPDGRIITPNYVTRHFKCLLKQNGLHEIRFHDLRHSSASYLLSLGFGMKEIQMWLGHENISTTMDVYAHLDIRAKQNMANTLNERFSAMGE